jgi:spore cortex biosynthesis protein YabQ
MEVSVSAQAAAFAGGLGLGFGLGLLYDLMRVARSRLRLAPVCALLDLLFWLAATLVLFLWTISVEGGQVRIYTLLSILAGGIAYFFSLSRPILALGRLAADLISLLLFLLTRPLSLLQKICKKIGKNQKNTFHYLGEWYRIKEITREMDKAARPRRGTGNRGVRHESQKSRPDDKACGADSSGIHGDHLAESPDPGSGRSGRAGLADQSGHRADPAKRRAGRRHRQQR